MRVKRDFQAELKKICAQETPQEAPKEETPEVPLNEPRFNVLKQTEAGTRFIEFGITMKDVLLGLDGRFKDTYNTRYHVVTEKCNLRTWKELYGDALQIKEVNV